MAKVHSLKDGIASSKRKFAFLWRDKENALLFRGLLLLIFFVGSVLTTSGVLLWKKMHPKVAHPEVADHAEAHVEKHADASSGHEAEANDKPADTPLPVMGVRAVSKEISKRQDGIQEADKDLVEPEIKKGRGLAAFTAEVAPTQPYNPFVTFLGIVGSTSERGGQVARLAIDISFEADSFVAMTELQAREKEVKFVVGSLVSEITYEDLRSEAGAAKLKERIFAEINYTLKQGKIRDVLFQNFVMR